MLKKRKTKKFYTSSAPQLSNCNSPRVSVARKKFLKHCPHYKSQNNQQLRTKLNYLVIAIKLTPKCGFPANNIIWTCRANKSKSFNLTNNEHKSSQSRRIPQIRQKQSENPGISNTTITSLNIYRSDDRILKKNWLSKREKSIS